MPIIGMARRGSGPRLTATDDSHCAISRSHVWVHASDGRLFGQAGVGHIPASVRDRSEGSAGSLRASGHFRTRRSCRSGVDTNRIDAGPSGPGRPAHWRAARRLRQLGCRCLHAAADHTNDDVEIGAGGMGEGAVADVAAATDARDRIQDELVSLCPKAPCGRRSGRPRNARHQPRPPPSARD